MIRATLGVSAACAIIAGCGSQYSDPILDQPAPPECPAQYVAQFDGASYGTAERLIQDDFTIEAWIATPSSPKGASFADGSALVFADAETVQLDDFATGLVNDKFVLSVGGPDTSASSVSDVTSNQWVHVAVSRKKSNGILLLYVDGVLEGSAVANTHTLSQSATISIGGRASRNFYTGLMSDLRLWRTVRAQSDIVAHMHQRLIGTEDGLVGYYRLDDDALEARARDASPSANDATLTGTVTWVPAAVPLCDLPPLK